jgi:hypothetical protein
MVMKSRCLSLKLPILCTHVHELVVHQAEGVLVGARAAHHGCHLQTNLDVTLYVQF